MNPALSPVVAIHKLYAALHENRCFIAFVEPIENTGRRRELARSQSGRRRQCSHFNRNIDYQGTTEITSHILHTELAIDAQIFS